MKRFSKKAAWSIGKVLTEPQYGYARSVGGGAA
ncbi:unknown [Clostridium sp. CAG:729]|nr:unknown [Clostridium sp. CAG:729]